MIGNLGDLTFNVTPDQVVTFNAMAESQSARYATHEVYGRRPVIQPLGPSSKIVELSMPLLRQPSTPSPEEIFSELEFDLDNGRSRDLYIGARYLGNFLITSLSMEHGPRSASGYLLRANLKIGLISNAV